jgi:hypothetical protein
MRTVRQVGEAVDAQVARDAPWKFGASGYQAVLGVHEPWAGEISPVQYARMGKAAKARYDKQRAGEWDASAAIKAEWRAAVEAAFRAGKFDPKDPDVHPEAASVVFWLQQADAKAAAAAARAEKDRTNEITDAKQLKVGDRVWLVIQRAYAEVLKVSAKSVQVRTPYGPYKVPVQARSPLLLRQDPREWQGEDRVRTVRALLDEMAETTRARLPKENFVFPAEKRWPIKPRKYAIYSIQYMVMGRGDSADYPAVKKAIRAAYGDDEEILGRLAKL